MSGALRTAAVVRSISAQKECEAARSKPPGRVHMGHAWHEKAAGQLYLLVRQVAPHAPTERWTFGDSAVTSLAHPELWHVVPVGERSETVAVMRADDMELVGYAEKTP